MHCAHINPENGTLHWPYRQITRHLTFSSKLFPLERAKRAKEFTINLQLITQYVFDETLESGKKKFSLHLVHERELYALLRVSVAITHFSLLLKKKDLSSKKGESTWD